MQQNKPSSSRRHPVTFYCISAAIATVSIVGNLLSDEMTRQEKHLIEWRTPTKGKEEALRTKKTILYFFTAAWCGPCHKLKSESFNDPKVADVINRDFVPVMVMDREHEDGHNTKEVKDLQEDAGIQGFPALMPVRWQLVNENGDDWYSVNHPVKKLLKRSYGYSFPSMSGYRPPDKVLDYFRALRIWMNLPPSKGVVSWKPFSNWNPNDRSRSRPQLLVIVDEYGSESDSLRMGLLANEKWGAYINKEFDAYFLESVKDTDFKEKPVITKFKKDFSIKNFPALIVTTSEPREPQILTGYPGASASAEFLERATRGKAKLPEEEKSDHVDYDYFDYYE